MRYKKPTTGWRKEKIQKWLEERGVSFDPKNTIPILLMKSTSFCPKKISAGGHYGKILCKGGKRYPKSAPTGGTFRADSN